MTTSECDPSIKIMILVGGLGNRLRSVVSDRPKPMADVSGRPFLEHQVRYRANQGFRNIVLCVGYLADHICAYFGDGSQFGLRIEYSVEKEQLGTAGAIKNAQNFVNGDERFVVMNGDSFLECDLNDMVERHTTRLEDCRDTVATIAAVGVENSKSYGIMHIGSDDSVCSFREKGSTESGWINGGIYVFERALLDLIPHESVVSLEQDTFPLALRNGKRVFAHKVSSYFCDIGTPQSYEHFRSQMKSSACSQ
jgi:NDP-sugar pyrophosphorylase family protein